MYTCFVYSFCPLFSALSLIFPYFCTVDLSTVKDFEQRATAHKTQIPGGLMQYDISKSNTAF